MLEDVLNNAFVYLSVDEDDSEMRCGAHDSQLFDSQSDLDLDALSTSANLADEVSRTDEEPVADEVSRTSTDIEPSTNTASVLNTAFWYDCDWDDRTPHVKNALNMTFRYDNDEQTGANRQSQSQTPCRELVQTQACSKTDRPVLPVLMRQFTTIH